MLGLRCPRASVGTEEHWACEHIAFSEHVAPSWIALPSEHIALSIEEGDGAQKR
jgi:hypothetical protein